MWGFFEPFPAYFTTFKMMAIDTTNVTKIDCLSRNAREMALLNRDICLMFCYVRGQWFCVISNTQIQIYTHNMIHTIHTTYTGIPNIHGIQNIHMHMHAHTNTPT